VPQIKFARRGRHHIEFEVRRHYDDAVKITKEVRAELRANPGGDLAKPVAWRQPIVWPNRMMMTVERDLATLGPEKVIDNAVRMIDIGSRDDLARAKSLLERVIGCGSAFRAGVESGGAQPLALAQLGRAV
jgi:hypothetical protein